MHTHDELLELLGEGELANLSMTFWLKYHPQGGMTEEEAFTSLLAFQNGWLACKEFYKIRD